MFIEYISKIYQNNLITILVLLFLAIASYFDIKNRKIPNELNLIFFIIRFIIIPIVGFNIGNVVGLLIGFFIIFIPAMIMNKPMGGDIKTMAVLGLYLQGYGIVFLLGILVIVSLVYTISKELILKKKIDIPFAPFFLISYILMELIISLGL